MPFSLDGSSTLTAPVAASSVTSVADHLDDRLSYANGRRVFNKQYLKWFVFTKNIQKDNFFHRVHARINSHKQSAQDYQEAVHNFYSFPHDIPCIKLPEIHKDAILHFAPEKSMIHKPVSSVPENV